MRRITSTKNAPKASGFSMVEVLVGIAIMSVTLVSLFVGQSAGFGLTKTAREDLRATQIMLERMEGVRLYNWNQLVYSNMIPENFISYYYPGAKNSESKGTTYRGKIKIGSVALTPPASYSTNMRSITVTLYWTNYYGPKMTNTLIRSRSMTTYASRDGIQNYVYNN